MVYERLIFGWDATILKSESGKKNQNIEEIAFKDVQMSFCRMYLGFVYL